MITTIIETIRKIMDREEQTELLLADLTTNLNTITSPSGLVDCVRRCTAAEPSKILQRSLANNGIKFEIEGEPLTMRTGPGALRRIKAVSTKEDA